MTLMMLFGKITVKYLIIKYKQACVYKVYTYCNTSENNTQSHLLTCISCSFIRIPELSLH